MSIEMTKTIPQNPLGEMFRRWDACRLPAPRNIPQEVKSEFAFEEPNIETAQRNRNLAAFISTAVTHRLDTDYFDARNSVCVISKFQKCGDEFDGLEVQIGSGRCGMTQLQYGEVNIPEFYTDSYGRAFQVTNSYTFNEQTARWMRVDEIKKVDQIPCWLSDTVCKIDLSEQPRREREMTDKDYFQLETIGLDIECGRFESLEGWSR